APGRGGRERPTTTRTTAPTVRAVAATTPPAPAPAAMGSGPGAAITDEAGSGLPLRRTPVTAATGSTTPWPTAWSCPPAAGRVVPVIREITCRAESPGRACRTRAATPATKGAAKLVPLIGVLAPSALTTRSDTPSPSAPTDRSPTAG